MVASVIAYCLFIRYYLNLKKVEKNENFEKICKQMMSVVAEFVDPNTL